MNCSQAIEYIHSLSQFGIKPGLDRIKALCELLGNPQDRVKFIHVAGTNGKGSTSTMIANVFKNAGYKVGLFTSPYVTDFRERIQLNGHMIDPFELAETVSQVKAAVDTLAEKGIQPTEFEAITAVAFLYFSRRSCDLAVLEVGLGGRYDSTNLISSSVVSVITSISMDHMSILGNTIDRIAAEKCGIIKYGGVCVTYPEQTPEAMAVIEAACADYKNKLIVPDESKLTVLSDDMFGSVVSYDSIKLRIPFTGIHMVKNAITAVEAVKAAQAAGFKADKDSIAAGISASAMPARLEILRNKPLTILDGGHNEGCAEALAQYIRAYLPGKRIIAVCSMMADKDYESYLRIMAPLIDTFIASKCSVPRALSSDRLCETAKKYCERSYSVGDCSHALAFAHSLAEEDDVILVCGSFYFAGETREKIMNF